MDPGDFRIAHSFSTSPLPHHLCLGSYAVDISDARGKCGQDPRRPQPISASPEQLRGTVDVGRQPISRSSRILIAIKDRGQSVPSLCDFASRLAHTLLALILSFLGVASLQLECNLRGQRLASQLSLSSWCTPSFS